MAPIGSIVDFREIDTFQSPLLLGFIAALGGHVPVYSPGEAFNYCELGCGNGATLVALASVYPQSLFVGIDANKEDILQANELCTLLGLENIRFYCTELSELQTLSLPTFQVVAISSIFGHVEGVSAKKLLSFAGSILQSKGLLYLQYPSYPGQTSLLPMWQLLDKLLGNSEGETPLERSSRALQLLARLVKRGVGFLNKQSEALKVVLDYISGGKPSDVQLERFFRDVLSRKHFPRYFDEVHDQMAEHSFDFAGSCQFARNDHEIVIPPSQMPTIREMPGVKERELLKDFVLNSLIRNDVFVKNSKSDPKLASAWVRANCAIMSRQAKAAIQRAIVGATGQRIPMQGLVFTALINAGDECIANFESIPDWHNEPERYLRATNRLLASGQFFLCRAGVEINPVFESEAPLLSAYNTWQLARAFETGSGIRLLSDKTGGTAILLDDVETLILYIATTEGWDGCCRRVMHELAGARGSQLLNKSRELNLEDVDKLIELLRYGQKAKNLMRLGIFLEAD